MRDRPEAVFDPDKPTQWRVDSVLDSIKGLGDALNEREKALVRERQDKRKLRVFVEASIAEIEGDERYHYAPAQVQINAPLALEQVAMKARMQVLREVQEMLL